MSEREVWSGHRRVNSSNKVHNMMHNRNVAFRLEAKYKEREGTLREQLDSQQKEIK